MKEKIIEFGQKLFVRGSSVHETKNNKGKQSETLLFTILGKNANEESPFPREKMRLWRPRWRRSVTKVAPSWVSFTTRLTEKGNFILHVAVFFPVLLFHFPRNYLPAAVLFAR